MSEIDSDQINVSDQCHPEIERAIYSNKHLFAKYDTSLGQADVVKMKINTEDHTLTNLNRIGPYNKVEKLLIKQSQTCWTQK